MRRRNSARLALACLLALSAGCGRSGEGGGAGSGAAGGVDKVVAEVSAFTDELMRKVEQASDASAGVAEAQALLDSRRAALAASVSALKKSPVLRESAEARKKWLEAEVDNTTRVSGLKSRLFEQAMRDPGLAGRLDKLVSDYQELFGD
jgi:hypothetical protein